MTLVVALWTRPSSSRRNPLNLTVDELEDVVEDEERSTLGLQLESLGIVHRSLLLVNLYVVVS